MDVHKIVDKIIEDTPLSQLAGLGLYTAGVKANKALRPPQNRSAIQAATALGALGSSLLASYLKQPSPATNPPKSQNTKQPTIPMTTPRRKSQTKAKSHKLAVTTTRAPAAKSFVVAKKPPQVRSVKGGTIISGQEFVRSVTGTASFTAVAIDINPGLVATYPWLSTQSKGWEKYKFHKFEVMYIPNHGTDTSGSIFLAFDYDPEDPPPTTQNQMATFQTVTQQRVWDKTGISLAVRQAFAGIQYKKIRRGPVAGDKSIYDPARLIYATNGCPSSEVGDIWVNYTIELRSQQSQIPFPISAKVSYLVETTQLSTRALTTLNFVNTASLEVPVGGSDSLDLRSHMSGTGIILPYGNYLLSLTYQYTINHTGSANADGYIEIVSPPSMGSHLHRFSQNFNTSVPSSVTYTLPLASDGESETRFYDYFYDDSTYTTYDLVYQLYTFIAI
jgi:hypothetical protein